MQRVRKCGSGYLPQKLNTCWLNAPLNALALTPSVYELIVQHWNGKLFMSPEEAKKVLFESDGGSCPTFSSYIHAFVTWRLINDQTLNTSNTNVAAKFASSLTQNLSQGGQSTIALIPLLKELLPERSYRVVPFQTYNGYVNDVNVKLDVNPDVLVRDGTIHFHNDFKTGLPPNISMRQHLTYSLPPTTYTLQAAVIGVSQNLDHSTHVIAAFVCMGKQFVYDAKHNYMVKTNWIDGDLSTYFDTPGVTYSRINKYESLIYLKQVELTSVRPPPPRLSSASRAASRSAYTRSASRAASRSTTASRAAPISSDAKVQLPSFRPTYNMAARSSSASRAASRSAYTRATSRSSTASRAESRSKTASGAAPMSSVAKVQLPSFRPTYNMAARSSSASRSASRAASRSNTASMAATRSKIVTQIMDLNDDRNYNSKEKNITTQYSPIATELLRSLLQIGHPFSLSHLDDPESGLSDRHADYLSDKYGPKLHECANDTNEPFCANLRSKTFGVNR